MELGPFTLQIYVSLFVILAAACIALICDILKRKNEALTSQVRELTAALKSEREEHHKRTRLAAFRAAERPFLPRKPKVAEEAATSEPVAKTTPEPEASAGATNAKASNGKRRTPSPEALAAMQKGVEKAAAPQLRIAARPVAAAPAAPADDKFKSKTDWNALLEKRRQAKSKTTSNSAAGQPSPIAAMPTGFHDGYVLSQMVQNHQPVSGLVVSIGVNAPAEAGSDAAWQESVKNFVGSLIEEGDFACRASENEFLLIYPREHGASAQRRLNWIAQQLWDFQLREMGDLSILFSWGGVEANCQAIDEAVASASEQMLETRRTRKFLTEPANSGQLRQAV